MTISPQIRPEEAARAARNAGILVVASVISKGLLFGWQLALASLLGLAAYGVYGTVGALLIIGAAITSFGMSLIAIRDVARAPHTTGAVWSAMLVAQAVAGLVAYLLINAGGALAGYSPQIQAYIALAGLSLFFDLFGNISYDLLIAREKMAATSTVEVAHILLRIALAGAAVLAGWGLAGLYLATFASSIARSLVLTALNLRDGLRPRWPVDRTILMPLLVNSAPLMLSSLLTLAYNHADKLLTTAVIGETGTGLLTPAFTISFGVIELLSTTVLVAVYPMMSRYYDEGRNPMFGFISQELALYMLIVSLPVALGLSILADDVIRLLFRPEYAPTAGILAILIWYTLLTMVGNVFAKAMLIQNRQRLLLLLRALSLVVNVALTLTLLVTWRDPRGAALATVFAEALLLGALVLRFRASGYDRPALLRAVVRVAAAGFAAGLVMLVLRTLNPWLAGGLGLLAYAAAIALLRALTPSDLDLIYRLLGVMPGGSLITRWWRRELPEAR
jgi:O-antigen/teichoic acid export membrane protein